MSTNQRRTRTWTYQDDLKQHFLIDLHELLVPLVNLRRLATRLILIAGRGGIVLVMVAPFDDFTQNSLVDLYAFNVSF